MKNYKAIIEVMTVEEVEEKYNRLFSWLPAALRDLKTKSGYIYAAYECDDEALAADIEDAYEFMDAAERIIRF